MVRQIRFFPISKVMFGFLDPSLIRTSKKTTTVTEVRTDLTRGAKKQVWIYFAGPSHQNFTKVLKGVYDVRLKKEGDEIKAFLNLSNTSARSFIPSNLLQCIQGNSSIRDVAKGHRSCSDKDSCGGRASNDF